MSIVDETRTVASAYAGLVAAGTISEDRAQLALVAGFDRLLSEFRQIRLSSKSSALGWLFGRKEAGRPRGIYVHGGVGRGKTMLMDMFFELCPGSKRRAHFNDFMTDAHERIAAQRKAFGEGKSRDADPIKPVGKAMAREAELLCFDEFTVTDIADAMIIGRLFDVMFKQGVVIVATSNVAPDDLYKDGINRALFLPFVARLKEKCEVLHLDAMLDFRLGKISRRDVYLSPIGAKTHARLHAVWRELSKGLEESAGEVALKGRSIRPVRSAGNNAWFTFEQLCSEAHGAADYLAIARRFSTLVIEGVPMMDNARRNEAKRFILLIDTLYDRGLRCIFSAQANPHALYQGTAGVESFEFKRTASRLIEMQSEAYLDRFESPESAHGSSN
jgi:cell division protein ZapE